MQETPVQTIERHSNKSIDYASLLAEWKIASPTPEQISRFRIESAPLPLLDRGFLVGQLDLDRFFEDIAQNKTPYIFLSKSPDDIFTVNEFLVFDLARHLQAALGCLVVIFIRDDIKVLNRACPVEKIKEVTRNCFKDLLAVGFDEARTVITSDYAYYQHMYQTVSELSKQILFEEVQPFFSFDTSDNIGKIATPCILAAPFFPRALPTIFPDPAQATCLVLDSIVNAPFLCFVRAKAQALGFALPAVLLHKHVSLLTGVTKLAPPTKQTSFLMTDTAVELRKKVNASFSGGKDTKEEQLKYGGDVEVDVPYHYLTLLCADSATVEAYGRDYAAGTLMSSQMKQQTVAALSPVVAAYQQRRKPITNKTVEAYQKAVAKFVN